MRRRVHFLAAALLPAGLLLPQSCAGWVGDGESDFQDRQPCTLEADCPDGWTCFDEECAKVCNVAVDCPAADQACDNGVCTPVANPACRAAADCPASGDCHDDDVPVTCVGGKCRYELRPVGWPCDDGDPCTEDDRCGADARCAGVAKLCDNPRANECTNGDTALVTYPSIGACEPSTGDCQYIPLASPCTDCAATCLGLCAGVICEETHGGCQGNVCTNGPCAGSGTCVPTDPATCSYERAADGTPCDPAGGPAGSLAGKCIDGRCGECASAADCTDPPTA